MTAKKSDQTRYIRRLWLLGLSPWILLVLVMMTAFFSNLPDIDTLANPKINLATQIYTSDDKVIGSYYRENRSDVRYTSLPAHLVDALLSTEDARFREHSGIDFKGLLRAVVKLGSDGGASTLTQQLAKMQFTKNYESVPFVKRVWQKLREMIIAARLERTYTKDEIIALYLNQVDFINQAVGIKSAAHVYFNCDPDSLTLIQSAMLVGMLQNPALYNPLKRDSLVQKRREVVLDQMVKYGHIAETEYDSLRVLPLGLDFQRVSHDEGPAPYFREVLRARIDEILQETDDDGNLLRQKNDGTQYDLYGDGLKIYTTIDSRMQEYAEWAVEEHLSRELQAEFTKDLGRRKKENYPFYNGIEKKDRERIMNEAIHSCDRYLIADGALCPECRRPKAYINKIVRDGKEYYICDTERKGCGEDWPVMSDKEIDAMFKEPVKMKIYAHGGYKDTTMSPLDSIRYHKAILHASLMSVEPATGFIKAWVGGVDYKYFKFDNVYQSRRQVGSTFKPFVYATALRNNDLPCSKYANLKTCIDLPTGAQWCPDNSDNKYGGEFTLEYALSNSVNTITAALVKKYGAESVVTLAKNLGIRSPLPKVPSIALGVAELSLYEMVGANAAFVNNGVYIEPTFILRIEDKNGNTIYEADPKIQQALDPFVAYELVGMMKGVINHGTGARLRSGRPYANISYPTAGKTGTTQNNTDGWFIGLTPDLVTGVWVGAQDPTVRFASTYLGQGANTGLPIYGYYMNKLYADKGIKISKGDFKVPEGYDPARFKCPGNEDLFGEDDDWSEDNNIIPDFNGELDNAADSLDN